MTASEMAHKRWATKSLEERSAHMRALAKRRHLLKPAQSFWAALRALECRLALIEVALSESADHTTGFNARLLERK